MGSTSFLYQQQAAGMFGLSDNPFSCLFFRQPFIFNTFPTRNYLASFQSPEDAGNEWGVFFPWPFPPSCQVSTTKYRASKRDWIGGRKIFDVFLEKNGKENGGKKASFPLRIGSEKIAGTVRGRRKTVYIHTYIHTYIHAWNDAGITPGGIVPRFCTGAWCAVRFQNVAADFFQDPARGCRGSQGSCNSSEWRGCRAVIARAMLELR